MFIHDLRMIWKMLCGGSVASGCFYPTVPTKVWIFLTVRPCVRSRGGEFSNRDVAGGGPQPCSGWALLNKRIAMVLSGLKVFINADFKDFSIS